MKNNYMKNVLTNCCRPNILIISLSLFFACLSATGYSQEINIGVLAKRGDEVCLAKWSATAHYLSEQLAGYKVQIVPLDFAEIVPAVEGRHIDFILANSAIYAGLEAVHGVSCIATMKNLLASQVSTVFGGAIFCKSKRQDIQTLNDLRGKRFMAVDRTSLGGWIMALREFKDHNINPDKDLVALSTGDLR